MGYTTALLCILALDYHVPSLCFTPVPGLASTCPCRHKWQQIFAFQYIFICPCQYFPHMMNVEDVIVLVKVQTNYFLHNVVSSGGYSGDTNYWTKKVISAGHIIFLWYRRDETTWYNCFSIAMDHTCFTLLKFIESTGKFISGFLI